MRKPWLRSSWGSWWIGPLVVMRHTAYTRALRRAYEAGRDRR